MSSSTSQATVYVAFTEVLNKSKTAFLPAIFYDHQYTAGGEPSSELKERVEKLRSMIISNQPDTDGSSEDQSEVQNADDQTMITLTKAMSEAWIQSARESIGCDTSDIEVKVCSMHDYVSDVRKDHPSS